MLRDIGYVLDTGKQIHGPFHTETEAKEYADRQQISGVVRPLVCHRQKGDTPFLG